MDPLSITASCIAILGASTATGKALRKLTALRNVPGDLQQLFNEREASRALLVVIQSTLHGIQDTAVYRNNLEALEQLLIRFRDDIGGLDELLEYELTQPEANSNGLPEARKLQWMKAGHKIRDIKQKIRDARSGLESALVALNIQQSADAHQTALQIQTIVFQNQEDSQNRHATLIEGFTTQRTESCRANERIQQSIADISAMGRELAQIDTRRHEELLSFLRDLQLRQEGGPTRVNAYDAAPLRNTIGHQANNDPAPCATAPSTVKITATMATNRCPPICKCCCHERTSFATPRCLRRFLGELMLDYTSLLQPKACNYPPCRKRPGKSHFKYVFPTWFASRALIANGTSGCLTGIGASWTLRIPFILPNSDPLWRYVVNDDLSSLEYHVSWYVPNLNVVNEIGYSPMLVATRFKSSRVKNLLEELRADSGGQARDGRTVSRLLVEQEIYNQDSLPQDPTDLFEELGFTGLHVAVAFPFYGGRLSGELLMANFVLVNNTDTAGRTPLHWAASRGDIASVKLLLEWKANVNAVDKVGFTPLMLACRNGFSECVQLLIDEGADVRVRTAFGETVLFFLSIECAGFVGQFIRSGVQLEQRNLYGDPALHASVVTRRSLATAALCEMGADIDSRNEIGQNAISIATLNNNVGGLETLVQHLPERSEMATTCDSDDVMQASSSNTNGTALYDVNQGEVSHSMPLPRPSRLTHWAPDKLGQNALHFAASCGGTQVMKILAGADLRGLDPLQQDQYGDTPDDCFYRDRDFHCTAVRVSFEEEEAAWRTLMDSARRQNGLLIDCTDDEGLSYSYDSNSNDEDQAVHGNVGDWGTSSDESDESQDEEIFQDAVQEL
ncbi:hypothetical protein D0865_00193 [Hortaea werneckii]|uniref:Azaphilone pigments biosynthesis cluster protein L N-terminal domain-containing protein n=1 Tax=Hortaea werneckii TaxID=91943 RepID=A0A3M7DEY9_HORWE|nr:hypothetical protein D0865_00193 [Hortaea werneckii]